jgi:hypothetical protein
VFGGLDILAAARSEPHRPVNFDQLWKAYTKIKRKPSLEDGETQVKMGDVSIQA